MERHDKSIFRLGQLWRLDILRRVRNRASLRRCLQRTGLKAPVFQHCLLPTFYNLTLPCIECRGFFLQREDLPYDYC